MTVDLSYRVDFAWVEPWSKAFYLYKHLVTWATVHRDRRGLKWQFWSRLHPVRNWKNGQSWSVSTIHFCSWKLGGPTLVGLEGSSLSVDMRGTPLTARNFLSMATILGWLHLTASWRGVLPHRSSTSRSTCIFDFTLLYWILPSENKPCRSRWGISRRPDGFRRKQDGELSSRRSLPCSCRLLPGRLSQEPSCRPEEKIKAQQEWIKLKREPVRQQTIAGQASGFAPRSFVLSDSSSHCCSLQSWCTKITRITNWFDCYRVKRVEVVDLDQLLSEHHPPGGVADGVQGRGPGGEPDHVGHHHQHDAGHSGLCGQTNLISF